MYWVVALLALSFLIVVHEAGHYFVALWCKMRINRFSIGFGPGIFKRQSKKTGTIFQIAPLPFGGFVEIDGMNIVEEVDPADKFAYPNRPAWQRFATILAGPATNFLSAFILAFVLFQFWGVRSVERWHAVGAMKEGYDATDKFKPEDRILAINGNPVLAVDADHTFHELRAIINANTKGEALIVTVRRGDELLNISALPKLEKDEDGKPLYRLGIAPYQQSERVKAGVLSSMKHALIYPFEQSAVIVGSIVKIIRGKEKADVGSGVRIVEEFKKAFSVGFEFGLELLMGLSVYLALFNLFPLPALDGGRLVFLGYELITRRRANPRIEATVHMVGVMLLVVVVILVTFKDCRRLISG
jgi:regulator of sigma E protease